MEVRPRKFRLITLVRKNLITQKSDIVVTNGIQDQLQNITTLSND